MRALTGLLLASGYRPRLYSCRPAPRQSGLQIRGSKFRSSSSKFRELELQNFTARSQLYRSQILQVNTRWKALAEIYTMHYFAPFWTPLHRSRGIRLGAPFWVHRFGIESQKTRKTMGGKRSWSNPGKTGQGKLIGSCNSLPSATLVRDLE